MLYKITLSWILIWDENVVSVALPQPCSHSSGKTWHNMIEASEISTASLRC